MNTREIFKMNLNKYIEASGKNKKVISEEMGVPYTTLIEWANGKKFPRADGIELVAEYFNVLKSDLLEEKNKLSDDNLKSENKIYSFLTLKEKVLIDNYRSKPEMQPAVDKLLGIADDNKNEKLTLITESEPKKITNRGRAVAFGGQTETVELTEENEKAIAEALSKLENNNNF